ncbi:MAG: hypothetical protein MHM6MM_006519 [Cercozoa sp. M6MM]
MLSLTRRVPTLISRSCLSFSTHVDVPSSKTVNEDVTSEAQEGTQQQEQGLDEKESEPEDKRLPENARVTDFGDVEFNGPKGLEPTRYAVLILLGC